MRSDPKPHGWVDRALSHRPWGAAEDDAWSASQLGFTCHLACNGEWRREQCPAVPEEPIERADASGAEAAPGGGEAGAAVQAPVRGVPVDIKQARKLLSRSSLNPVQRRLKLTTLYLFPVSPVTFAVLARSEAYPGF